MRTIKFRAWNKTSKCMDTEFAIHADGCIYQSARRRWDMSDISVESAYEDLEIMQFTGLKDKNGKEIYENDIIMATCSKSGDKSRKAKRHKCVIEWSNLHRGWCLSIIDINAEDKYATGYSEWGDNGNVFEIIGNIHDNPELLTTPK